MPRPRPQYLHKDTSRHGTVRWYVRKGKHGKKHRIREDYGTPEFQASYEAALQAIANERATAPPPKADGGTLEWGWLLYRIESSAWKALSRATRRQRENIMHHVITTGGTAKIGTIDRAAIVAGVDRRAATPFQAKNFLQTMRGLFAWFLETGKIKLDPTAGVKVKKPKTNGFPEWDYSDILKYETRWPIGTRERVMLDVYCYTGLRRGDAARVGGLKIQ